MQNPQATATPVQEYKEPVNYIGAVIGALLGGALAVGIWAAGVYFLDSVYYYLLAFVGGIVGAGATFLARGNNWQIGIISLLVTAIALVVGDYVQMMYVADVTGLSLDRYIEYTQQLASENMIQYIIYAVALAIGFFVGTFGTNRNAN